MLVKDIMTTGVITVTPETSLKEVGMILKEKRISGLPVVDHEHRVVGIITLTDMLRILDQIHHWQAVEARVPQIHMSQMYEKEKTESKVKNIMTQPVFTLDENSPFEELIYLMFDKKIHTIPVTREGKLVGVVGKRDLIYSSF